MGSGAEKAGEAVDQGRGTSGVYVKIPASLHRELKAEAALAGRNLEDLAGELLELGIQHSPYLRVVNGGQGK